MLGPHCGGARGGPKGLFFLFQVVAFTPFVALAGDCASFPRREEASPCRDDQESQSPAEDTGPFPWVLDVKLVDSPVPLALDLPPTATASLLEGCLAGIGEMPRDAAFGAPIEKEDDVTAPSSVGSRSFSSLKEMSLRFRGRIVDVMLLGNKLSLLLMVAAAADRLGEIQ